MIGGEDLRDVRDDKAVRSRWRWSAGFLAAMVVVGIAVGVFYLVAIRPTVSADQYGPPRPPVPLAAAYYATVKARVAQGLGLTVAEVDAGIGANPREGLFGVATARGVSPDQLYSLELAALQAAGDQMVTAGAWTPRQADATMTYWRQRGAKALGSDVTDWFLHR